MVRRVRSVRGTLLLIGCSIVGLYSTYYLDLSSTLLVVVDHHHEIGKTRSVVHSCDDGYVFMRNRIVPNDDVTNSESSRKIPKRIHFIVPSRCIPMDVAASINSTWYTLEDYSIYFHDPQDIREYTLKGKEMFPSMEDAFLCAKYSRAKFEIARFAILWELGGIALDIHQIPHSSILTNIDNVLVKDEDECVFENNQGNVVNPRFIACAPQHTVLYVAITLFVNQFNILHQCFNEEHCSMEQLQNQMYLGFMFRMKSIIQQQKGHDSTAVDNNSFQRKYFINQSFFLDMKITQIYAQKGGEPLFTPMEHIPTNDLELKVSSPHEYENQCKAFMVYDNTNHNSNHTNTMESLMEVLVGKENVDTFQKEKRTTGSCSEGLKFVSSRLSDNTNNTNSHTSKIPKIIHMTSKSYCFTDGFVKNIELWFVEGYSFFLHDDDAVDRLFYGREWPQFPLLREALACIPSGAGKADLWRYLLLWEYGGIYTDMDNAPGPHLFFPNHTSSITDDMDAFFEQERGGFPSQYFFASKCNITLYCCIVCMMYDDFFSNYLIFLFLCIVCSITTSSHDVLCCDNDD